MSESSIIFGRRYNQTFDELNGLLEKEPNFRVAYWGLGMRTEEDVFTGHRGI
jgi:hypothetical protein